MDTDSGDGGFMRRRDGQALPRRDGGTGPAPEGTGPSRRQLARPLLLAYLSALRRAEMKAWPAGTPRPVMLS
jgi:hypothetical protein